MAIITLNNNSLLDVTELPIALTIVRKVCKEVSWQ
jgi:hypothetical protein